MKYSTSYSYSSGSRKKSSTGGITFVRLMHETKENDTPRIRADIRERDRSNLFYFLVRENRANTADKVAVFPDMSVSFQ